MIIGFQRIRSGLYRNFIPISDFKQHELLISNFSEVRKLVFTIDSNKIKTILPRVTEVVLNDLFEKYYWEICIKVDALHSEQISYILTMSCSKQSTKCLSTNIVVYLENKRRNGNLALCIGYTHTQAILLLALSRQYVMSVF